MIGEQRFDDLIRGSDQGSRVSLGAGQRRDLRPQTFVDHLALRRGLEQALCAHIRGRRLPFLE
jgi:hypothetical protein